MFVSEMAHEFIEEFERARIRFEGLLRSRLGENGSAVVVTPLLSILLIVVLILITVVAVVTQTSSHRWWSGVGASHTVIHMEPSRETMDSLPHDDDDNEYRKSTVMISTACEFLNELERAHRTDRDLPLPFVMSRICDLLTQKLQFTVAAVTTPPSCTPKQTNLLSCGGGNGGGGSSGYDSNQRQRQRRNKWQRPAAAAAAATTATTTTTTTRKEDVVAEFRDAIEKIVSMNNTIYVDIQCLNSDHGYVIKEFSATCVGAPTAWIMVESPLDARPIVKDNRFVINRLHNIYWTAGFICEYELRVLTNTLFASNRKILVKGQQKIDMLVNKLDIEPWYVQPASDTCPKLSVLRETYDLPSCPYHRLLDSSMKCTTKHTHALMIFHEEEITAGAAVASAADAAVAKSS